MRAGSPDIKETSTFGEPSCGRTRDLALAGPGGAID
jgi:hypothetical protein